MSDEVEEKKSTGFFGKVDEFFGIGKSGSSFRTEIVAGVTTFMAMVYILMVNAGMFSEPWVGLSYGAAYIATAIGAIVGTLLMAFLAKMPLAQASGMGINAFICYTLLLNGTGLTYANCMVFTLIDGVIFLVLTGLGLRQKILEAIPSVVRAAVPVGIGMFIAFIGFQNAGIIVNDDSTLVTFVSFDVLKEGATLVGMLPAAITLFGTLAIAILEQRNIKGGVLWGILGSAAVYYAVLGIAAGCGDTAAADIFGAITFQNPFNAFGDWGTMAVGKVFTDGFDFSAFLGSGTPWALILTLITTALSLCMIDMFDTIGTLYGACARGNLLDENGMPINMGKSMLADSIATCTGAIAGTSTVTTFVESSSGVAAGGKTGFTALVTAICFILAMFISPIAQLIPSCATSTALVYVGVLMMTNVTKIDWQSPADGLVAFLTFIVMCLGYSISKGIGVGILAYILISIFTGKVKDIPIPTWVIGALYVATFLLT